MKKFEFNPQTGEISGPADYLATERFKKKVADIASGRCHVVSSGYAPDVKTAVEVSLQTDYSAWKGAKTLGGFNG